MHKDQFKDQLTGGKRDTHGTTGKNSVSDTDV